MHPVLCSKGGRPVLSQKPRQPQAHWAEMMQPLPGQVLRPLRDARDTRRSVPGRRTRLNHARQELRIFAANMQPWMADVYAMMDRRGRASVDQDNPLQAEAFLARLSKSGRDALAKCQRVRAAIAYAEMTIEWLEWELAHGN
ncbi:hypothetical protein MQC88_08300 [Luteimonas sp. 50]|uniref:Uncharacterized protein n=1 Tax=Cognatiluteimonas sedimenti TaxID=2927791 RepID=A0ABT0A4Q8_9GAMM|nr:hypothetical protein [Lysobacter sedimenti]MCJ0825955.1 hypothetical protein [Lysobacter sedimenti]